MNSQFKQRKFEVHRTYEDILNFMSNPKEIQIKQYLIYIHIPIRWAKIRKLNKCQEVLVGIWDTYHALLMGSYNIYCCITKHLKLSGIMQ